MQHCFRTSRFCCLQNRKCGKVRLWTCAGTSAADQGIHGATIAGAVSIPRNVRADFGLRTWLTILETLAALQWMFARKRLSLELSPTITRSQSAQKLANKSNHPKGPRRSFRMEAALNGLLKGPSTDRPLSFHPWRRSAFLAAHSNNTMQHLPLSCLWHRKLKCAPLLDLQAYATKRSRT